jgi:hypothetical protein
MMDYYNMWMKQYLDALDFMTYKMEVKKQVINSTLQTNEYVPFKDNGLDGVMKLWAIK